MWDVERTRPGRVKNLKYLLTSSSPPSARTRKSSLDASFTVGGAAARESARGRLVAMPSPSRASALRLRADLLDVDAVTPGTDFYILLRLSLVDPTPGAASSSASASASARVRGVDVAWHGVERLDPAWVRPSSSRGGGGDGALALGERYVARSPAGTIATDTTVAPGEAREHVVGVRLPPGLPPTYRGSVARYAYHVTFVATYTLGDEDDATTRAETLRVPLRVLSENADAAAVENAFDHLWSVSTAGPVPAPWSRDENGTPRHPSSPLGSPGSPLAAAVFLNAPPTRARGFNIVLDDGTHLLRVLPRDPLPRIEPGTTVSGVLDLTAAAGDSRCVRADVSLETRETVVVGAGRGEGTSAGAGHESLEAAEAAGKALVLPKVWAETSEHTAGTLRTHFALAIPAEAPPTFRAANVAVRWVLRFEFYAAPARDDGGGGADADDPRTRRVEWTMPVEMMSAAPRASANGTAAAARERARRGVGRGVVQTGWDAGEETGEEADGPGMVRESSLFAIT